MWCSPTYCVVVVSVVALSLQSASAQGQRNSRAEQFTQELADCYQSKNDLAGCLKEFLIAQKETLKDGIPELEIPALEPARFPRVDLRDSSGWEGTFKDIAVFGLTGGFNEQNLGMTADLDRKLLSMSFEFPRLKIGGRYSMTTFFLNQLLGPLFPRELAPKSIGIFTLDLRGVEASGTGRIEAQGDVFRVSGLDIDFTFNEQSTIELKGSAGNPALTNILNTVLNDKETARAIVEELKPELRVTLNSMIQGILNNALKNLPVVKQLGF